MDENPRARRDFVIALLCTALVVGLIAYGVNAVENIPYLFDEFTAWKWRIFMAIGILPFAVLGIFGVTFAIIRWLTGLRDGKPTR